MIFTLGFLFLALLANKKNPSDTTAIAPTPIRDGPYVFKRLAILQV